MSAVIRIENLSKRYRLGQIHGGSLAEKIQRAAGALFGHRSAPAALKASADSNPSQIDEHGDFWALRGISLDVHAGEVVGIVGRNGAGKSTLLKILSRIVSPTAGRAELHGRVASLLEVGTGFHPELTGRENVYLNGAILGMSRAEIRSRFQDIQEFAGIEAFIDTPVKRYSSGMYVRLAFAVASQLQSDILIVDEVLAVGDAAFQQRCLGKIDDLAKSGRTVLVVSHNMAFIQKLCTHVLYMAEGRLKCQGSSEEMIKKYLSDAYVSRANGMSRSQAPGNACHLVDVALVNSAGTRISQHVHGNSLNVKVTYQIPHAIRNLRIGIEIVTDDGVTLWVSTTEDGGSVDFPQSPGTHSMTLEADGHILGPGTYYISCAIDVPGVQVFDNWSPAAQFSIIGNPLPRGRKWEGLVSVPSQWRS